MAIALASIPLRHEVPRLGHVPEAPVACDVQDAEGLRRIVDAQAFDLV